jgi:hypothetical protein
MRRFIVLLLCSFTLFCLPSQAKLIKVLAIGNSFSQDAVEQYLFELAKAQGDSLVIGNAFIGGCSIEHHYNNLRNETPDYAYRKIIGGIKAEHNRVTLQQIIRDEPWDIISFQQVSQNSGLPDSFTYLLSLMRLVKTYCSNLHTQFVWHMTWAYANDFASDRFAIYEYNQHEMYSAIVGAMHTVLPSTGIKRIIPSGLAIQLARNHFGDVLNRDGFHLSYTTGRYIAACTWCEFLTGRNVDGNRYHPDTITDEDAQYCQQAAHEAIFMQRQGRYSVGF